MIHGHLNYTPNSTTLTDVTHAGLWPSTRENSQTTRSMPGSSVKHGAKIGEIDLGLSARRGLKADLQPGGRSGPDSSQGETLAMM